MREAGLEAKWGKTRYGRPCLFVRDPQSKNKHQRETWWMVDAKMWDAMKKHGVKLAFDNHTLLGDIFSVNA